MFANGIRLGKFTTTKISLVDWYQFLSMPARPRISYEKKGELFDLAEDIEPTEPNKERSFSEALEVILGYVDTALGDATEDMGDIECIINEPEPEGINLGALENQGSFNQNNRF